jgi:hypothetical protein
MPGGPIRLNRAAFPDSPQKPDSPAGFLEPCRGHPAYGADGASCLQPRVCTALVLVGAVDVHTYTRSESVAASPAVVHTPGGGPSCNPGSTSLRARCGKGARGLWCVCAVAAVIVQPSKVDEPAPLPDSPPTPFMVVVRTIPITKELPFEERWQVPAPEAMPPTIGSANRYQNASLQLEPDQQASQRTWP